MPTSDRSLPLQPSLEQQKKQAKGLLRAYREDQPDARARVRRHLPDRHSVTLADAQFVIAREYGFQSWAALRTHIEQVRGEVPRPVLERIHGAFAARDARAVRDLLQSHPAARAHIDSPLFPFDSPALLNFLDESAMVDVLLEFGADPNRRSDWWAGGFHPLHSATGAVADRLLAAGAVPDACAAANLDRPELLRQILDADAARVHERGGDGQTPLHFARSREVVDLLLERGADIDALDVDHRSSPAQWMLERRRGAGRYELAKYLVERGASVDIFLATALGLTDVLRRLIDADPMLLERRTGRGEYGEQPPGSYHIYFWTIGANLSPLQVAAQFEHDEALAVLRARSDPKLRFLAACATADVGEAEQMLRERPGLISELTRDDHRLLSDAAWAPNPAAVELMMELGFDPTAPGQDGGSALHCAAWQGSAAGVRAVLGHARGRTLIDTRDPTHHSTPLGWCIHGAGQCARVEADHAAVARLLLDAGAGIEEGWQESAPAVREVIRSYR
jgi:ankyrin repeat protein